MQALGIDQLRWLVLMLGGGLVLTLLMLLGFHGRSARQAQGQQAVEERHLREHYQDPKALPWFLVLVWAAAGLFIIGYVLWAALGRTNF